MNELPALQTVNEDPVLQTDSTPIADAIPPPIAPVETDAPVPLIGPRKMRDVSLKTIDDVAQMFSQLEDATRLRILLILHDGDMNVTDMCGELGASQPAVSHHLALMRIAGLVQVRRSGKKQFL